MKPTFWGSATVAQLTRDARLLLLGLISNADDDGRFLASLNAINGAVFPNDDLPPAKVARWFNELIDVGVVHLYTVASVRYGCFPTWHEHQVIDRYSPSPLPPPDIECRPRRSRRTQ